MFDQVIHQKSMVANMNGQTQKIWDDLNHIASQRRMVSLVTNFRGIPINLAVRVVRCSLYLRNVRLYAPHHQIVSLIIAERTLVQSDLFPHIVTADIDQVDLNSNIIILSNLRYASGSIGQRKNVRVQPEQPLHAAIRNKHDFRMLGQVIDLSLEGLSVTVQRKDFLVDDLFTPQASVEICLAIPQQEGMGLQDLKILAKVAYVNSGQQTYRIGLLTFPTDPDKDVLRRYIFDRQTEILAEIQRMNNRSLETA